MQSFFKPLLVGAGAFVLSGPVASAEVMCNEDGDCWARARALRVQARATSQDVSRIGGGKKKTTRAIACAMLLQIAVGIGVKAFGLRSASKPVANFDVE